MDLLSLARFSFSAFPDLRKETPPHPRGQPDGLQVSSGKWKHVGFGPKSQAQISHSLAV